jgi:hypothetical protein
MASTGTDVTGRRFELPENRRLYLNFLRRIRAMLAITLVVLAFLFVILVVTKASSVFAHADFSSPQVQAVTGGLILIGIVLMFLAFAVLRMYAPGPVAVIVTPTGLVFRMGEGRTLEKRWDRKNFQLKITTVKPAHIAGSGANFSEISILEILIPNIQLNQPALEAILKQAKASGLCVEERKIASTSGQEWNQIVLTFA